MVASQTVILIARVQIPLVTPKKFYSPWCNGSMTISKIVGRGSSPCGDANSGMTEWQCRSLQNCCSWVRFPLPLPACTTRIKCGIIIKCSVRLSVRTLPFHGSKTSSILVPSTIAPLDQLVRSHACHA